MHSEDNSNYNYFSGCLSDYSSRIIVVKYMTSAIANPSLLGTNKIKK
ncbi:MAG: hypothetical protein O4804_03120 [Trichodesmium sp. St11_bin5]|nr:hypothetical protein [Trichodesmium sp. St11_bin5]